MSKRSLFLLEDDKETWQVEFEEERVNDERWSCVVAAAVESQVGDEEWLKLFSETVRTRNPAVVSLTMADMVKTFKTGKNPSDSKVKGKEGKGKGKGKGKEELKPKSKATSGDPLRPPPRHPEVADLVSKSLDRQSRPSPELLAYALKYMILHEKDTDCFKKRLARLARRKAREAEIAAQLAERFYPKPSFVEEEFEGETRTISQDVRPSWKRDNFDILGGSGPFEGPYNGPDLYILLLDFYDTQYLSELQKLHVPVVALIRVQSTERKPKQKSRIDVAASIAKVDLLTNFWTELEERVTRQSTSAAYKDLAFLKYELPHTKEDHLAETVTDDLIAILFTAYQLNRLHKSYLQQMKVYRMVEALEPLDLSRCLVYNRLCDMLMKDATDGVILILYSIIEQVVSGVPKTCSRVVEYSMEPVQDSEEVCEEETEVEEEEYLDDSELRFTPDFLSEVQEGQERPSGYWKNPEIYFYDDHVSLGLLHVDRRLLTPSAIFERFVINSSAPLLWRRFPSLTEGQRILQDYNFFLFKGKSPDPPETMRLKVHFSVAMKLIQYTKSSVTAEEDVHAGGSLATEGTASGEDEEFPQIPLVNLSETFCNQYFQEVIGLFYRTPKRSSYGKDGEGRAFRDFGAVSVGLRKAEPGAMTIEPEPSPSVVTDDDPCGRIRTIDIDVTTEDDGAGERMLQKFFDSPDLTYLNEPNVLVKEAEYEDMARRYMFMERLEPNRMVQRIQKAKETYSAVQYNYFAPTDTLFILTHNDADARGISNHMEKGFIASPLPLRDFLLHELPLNRKWWRDENVAYLAFVESLHEKAAKEEYRRDHEYKCGLVKAYQGMSEAERIKFLEKAAEEVMIPDGRKTSGRKRRDTERKSDGGRSTVDELEELPVKVEQPPPKRFSFVGFNIGSMRVQVNATKYQFLSKEGVGVAIRKQTWLYGDTLLSLTIHRMNRTFYLHRWKVNEVVHQSARFTDPSGVMFTFSGGQLYPETERRMQCTVTWPTGLVVQPLTTASGMYLRQSYTEAYRSGVGVETELCRCYTSRGEVLIYRENGSVDVLCPGGMKYGCHRFTWPERKKRRPCTAAEMRARREGKREKPEWKLEVDLYDILTPTGEYWVRDDCSKCKSLVATTTVLVGIDARNRESFSRREDGTSCMLWPSGKLVTTYPDETKITSLPEFEAEEIQTEMDEEEEEGEQEEGEGEGSEMASKPGTPNRTSSGFVSIRTSYLIEHPKYATAFFSAPHLDVRMPGGIRMHVTPDLKYVIESGDTTLMTRENAMEFYNTCPECRKMSTTVICLNPMEATLCSNEDCYNERFYVYSDGDILHESPRKSREDEPQPAPESSEPVANSCTTSVVDAAGEKVQCKHVNKFSDKQRCFALERDLTGVEFIHGDNMARYIGRLSDSAFYDLEKASRDDLYLVHKFFEPVREVGAEKWLMKYEADDSQPSQLKRKDLVPLRDFEQGRSRYGTQNYRQTFATRDHFRKRSQSPPLWHYPKVVLVRCVMVLSVDPIQIMSQVKDLVVLHQKKVQELESAYLTPDKKMQQRPFARYIDKELQLIASSLCRSMDLYPHTCTTIPYTDLDIHAIAHKLNMNDTLAELNPVDLRMHPLPHCRQIPKPLRHEGKDEDIPEFGILKNDDPSFTKLN